MSAYSGRWSPTVTQAERRARRARGRRVCRCATDPENAPCPECEAKAEMMDSMASAGREVASGEPQDVGDYVALEYGPQAREW